MPTRTLPYLLALGFMVAPLAGAAQQPPAPPAGSGANQTKQLEALQDRIEAQPEMMEAVRSLLADPAFQDVLDDPEITAALESGNLAVLLANPKISALANHPTVQEVSKRLGQ